jgi:chromosome segregation ATPase
MEVEQIVKQVDWLDDERRKDKDLLTKIEARLAAVEASNPTIPQQIADLNSEVTRLAAVVTRMDHFDEVLMQQRIEFKQLMDELEKQIRKRDEEAEKVRRVEMRALEASLADLRKELTQLPELKRAIQARVEEESRLGKAIDDVRLRIEGARRSEEEYTRSYRLLEDGRRQDAKRLTDLQGEVASLRKRADDSRGRLELLATGQRKIETRLNEMATLETERREAQVAFLENQALLQVERERVWKEWQARFDTIEKQTADVEANLQALDATHRAVKRSQTSLDELNQKVERRINEITEIQRLAEERFRQEWVTFKADDQKRWTNYTLTQEEQRGEALRQYERLAERVTHLEDTMEEIQDLIQLINEGSEKRLQSLLAMAHEWVTAYERTLGRAR